MIWVSWKQLNNENEQNIGSSMQNNAQNFLKVQTDIFDWELWSFRQPLTMKIILLDININNFVLLIQNCSAICKFFFLNE